MLRVFFSRAVTENSILSEYCAEKNIQLIAQSLISFKPSILKENPKPFDVIFFSSPRAFDYFKLQVNWPVNTLLACISKKTKDHIKNQGYSVDFFGSNGTQPKIVAQEFGSWLGERQVLFPISNMSNRSISSVLNTKQVQEVVVYETLLQEQYFSNKFDVLIFSSPSNAQAFLEKNTPTPDQLIAVYGATTKNFVTKSGWASEVLEDTSEEAIVAYLKKHL